MRKTPAPTTCPIGPPSGNRHVARLVSPSGTSEQRKAAFFTERTVHMARAFWPRRYFRSWVHCPSTTTDCRKACSGALNRGMCSAAKQGRKNSSTVKAFIALMQTQHAAIAKAHAAFLRRMRMLYGQTLLKSTTRSPCTHHKKGSCSRIVPSIGLKVATTAPNGPFHGGHKASRSRAARCCAVLRHWCHGGVRHPAVPQRMRERDHGSVGVKKLGPARHLLPSSATIVTLLPCSPLRQARRHLGPGLLQLRLIEPSDHNAVVVCLRQRCMRCLRWPSPPRHRRPAVDFPDPFHTSFGCLQPRSPHRCGHSVPDAKSLPVRQSGASRICSFVRTETELLRILDFFVAISHPACISLAAMHVLASSSSLNRVVAGCRQNAAARGRRPRHGWARLGAPPAPPEAVPQAAVGEAKICATTHVATKHWRSVCGCMVRSMLPSGSVSRLWCGLCASLRSCQRFTKPSSVVGAEPGSRVATSIALVSFWAYFMLRWSVSQSPLRMDSMLPADCGDDGFLRMFQPFSSISTSVLGILGRASVSPGMLGERPASCVTCAREGARLSSIFNFSALCVVHHLERAAVFCWLSCAASSFKCFCVSS